MASAAGARTLMNEAAGGFLEASQRSMLQTSQSSSRHGGGVGHIQCSRLTASLRQKGSTNRNGREAQELMAILNSSASCATPASASCFGVSPPLRSGAANPQSHDISFTRDAYTASHRSLQVLRELETASAGLSFVREDSWCRMPTAPPANPVPAAPKATVAGCSPITPFACRVEYFAV